MPDGGGIAGSTCLRFGRYYWGVSGQAESRIRVKPILMVSKNGRGFSPFDSRLFSDHLQWAQDRFHTLLLERDTFALESDVALELQSEQEASFWENDFHQGADVAASELFSVDRVDRMTCCFVYIVLFVGVRRLRGDGGGTPFNGGINTGGGIVVLPGNALRERAHFQTSLRHEIGHTLGLVHPDSYGYNLHQSQSIMSYNIAHYTNGLIESATPGTLIPEDYRVLSKARRVLPNFHGAEPPIPQGYFLRPISLLAQRKIPGQIDYHGPQIVE